MVDGDGLAVIIAIVWSVGVVFGALIAKSFMSDNDVKPHKTVEKKILPLYMEAVATGEKRFELRKDEDDIQVGDTLILKEWDGDYTGLTHTVKVKYVLRNVPEYGLQDGYCIIGF